MSLLAFELDATSHKLCIVCGLGLLGTAIAHELALKYPQVDRKDFFWDSPDSLVAEIQAVASATQVEALELVWSAGRAGFFAPQNELDIEVFFFTQVIGELKSTFGKKLCVSLLSSAGGIYEKAGFVTSIDQIAPCRPYAFAKLKQEGFLQNNDIRRRVYRVSSAYGLGGYRQGLIKTLIDNANSGKLTQIYAQQNTLRDYVYTRDVARILNHDIEFDVGYSISILASGRAISINTLLNMISKITQTVPKVYFSTRTENESDISFSTSLVRTGPNPTSLEEGLRLLCKQLTFSSHR